MCEAREVYGNCMRHACELEGCNGAIAACKLVRHDAIACVVKLCRCAPSGRWWAVELGVQSFLLLTTVDVVVGMLLLTYMYTNARTRAYVPSPVRAYCVRVTFQHACFRATLTQHSSPYSHRATVQYNERPARACGRQAQVDRKSFRFITNPLVPAMDPT